MEFSDEAAERLYRQQFASQRLRSDQFYGLVQIIVSVQLTIMFGAQQELRHPNQLLWSSTLFSLAMLAPSVLRPRLYIRARPYLTFAARTVLGVLMPQLIYELARYPYKGSSIITYTPGAFAAVWWYNSRWLGELIATFGFLNLFNVELVLVSASMFMDVLNNKRTCEEICTRTFHRTMFNQLANLWSVLTGGQPQPGALQRPHTCPADDTDLLLYLESYERATTFCASLFLVSQLVFTLILPLLLVWVLEFWSRCAFLQRRAEHLGHVTISCEGLRVMLIVLGASMWLFLDFMAAN